MPVVQASKEKDDGSDSSFTLRNAGSGFEGRSSNVFGQLDVLERQHISHEQNRTDLEEFADLRKGEDDCDFVKNERNSSATQKSDDAFPDRREDCFDAGDAVASTSSGSSSEKAGDSKRKHDRRSDEGRPTRREPQFRQPSGRPPGRNRGQRGRVQDHGNRPQTWTHYSLEDVSGSDMSEKSNTQAALAFLDEQRKLKAQQEEGMEEEEAFDVGSAACSKGLFSFAKRSKTDKSSTGPSKDKPDKDHLSVLDTEDQDDEDASPTTAVELAADSVQASEEESAESSSSATKDTAQASFKSRKGIKRNIRVRDDDD